MNPTTTDDAKARCARLQRAAQLLKALGHEGRLGIVCYLAHGERSVSELEGLLGMRQAAVSQQLARLRQDGIVSAERRGKAIIYSLTSGPVREMIVGLLESAEREPTAIKPSRPRGGRAGGRGS